ncbi:putative Large ribosomal subunit protein mL50 [Seiridium cardinale]|uniref:Large ribosomal subunit protein mL50 n=1 Tax=Seiridium cardinale TaxID=138064 RepID=A0ABR2X7H1_9PEZI
MRRIARLRKPSGWACATPRQPIAALSTPCAAPGSPLSAARTATRTACANSLRFYSQKPPLPNSLSSQQNATEQTLVEDEFNPDHSEIENEAALLNSAFRPPPARDTAPTLEEVSDPSYTPAHSSDGLTSVGGLEDWWERRENWAKDGDFSGFKAKKKIQDPRVLETAVRRAVVEAVVLKSGGHQYELVHTWPIGTEEEMARALALDIECSADGVATVLGDYGNVSTDVVSGIQDVGEPKRLTADGQESAVAMCSTEEATAYLKSWDPSWKRISIADPPMKFAITKRIFQLTGQRVPDHKLNDIDTVAALLIALNRPEKPKTLTEDILKTRQQLVQLPNVAFSPKQVTRGDKAKAKGQYKIIEEELKKRDLQGGPLSVPPSREKHWFRGQA